MPSDDPFLLDQAALESKLKLLQENFERWRQIRDCGDVAEFVASAGEFNWLCVELSQGIKNAGWDLDDLEETLKLMTESRQLAVSDADHRTRRQFIANSRQLLSQISAEVLPSAGGRPSATGPARRGGGSGADPELLTTGSVGDHFAEEPANLDLLSPTGDDGGFVSGGRIGGSSGATAAWKRRLGAVVTFGPLRQMGLQDDVAGGSRGGSGGCWACLMRHRMRLLATVVLAFLIALLIAGIAVAVRGSGVSGSDGNHNATSPATATSASSMGP